MSAEPQYVRRSFSSVFFGSNELHKVIQNLVDHREIALREGWKNLKLELSLGYEDSIDIEITGERLESAYEVEARLSAEKAFEEREKEELKRLARKYPSLTRTHKEK
jgi:hypothetical protein